MSFWKFIGEMLMLDYIFGKRSASKECKLTSGADTLKQSGYNADHDVYGYVDDCVADLDDRIDELEYRLDDMDELFGYDDYNDDYDSVDYSYDFTDDDDW